MNRIDDLYQLHAKYNEEEFSGKLNTITILIKRNVSKDGWYEYDTQRRKCDGPGKGSGWYPRQDALDRANIVINSDCWKEGSVKGTMLHEMVHQYQAEILDRPTSHDAIFCSIARRLERKHGFEVR